MSIELKSPTFPESVADGTIANWVKKEGESVKQDEVIAELETDKVVLEVVAPFDGVISKVLKPAGEVVLSAELIAEFEEGGEPERDKKSSPKDLAKLSKEINTKSVNTNEIKSKVNGPAVKKLLKEHDLDESSIEGAGIATFSQGVKLGGGNPLQEKAHINTTAWSASVAAGDINLDYGMVHLNTTVLAGTGNTLNVTSSVGINTGMVTGDIIAVTGITSVNATTAFVNTLKIDHTTVQVAWVDGSAPTAGGGSGYDTYSFNIIKTADAKYAVIGNQIKTS